MKSIYVVDYDLPADNGRRQFYRHLHRVLRDCHWKKSSNSVILVETLSTAQHIAGLAKAYNANYVNVYRAIPEPLE